MKMQKGSIDPSTLLTIKYCKYHGHYINLHPHISSGKQGYRVVCPDCGTYGSWEETVKEAIETWNKKHGISA